MKNSRICETQRRSLCFKFGRLPRCLQHHRHHTLMVVFRFSCTFETWHYCMRKGSVVAFLNIGIRRAFLWHRTRMLLHNFLMTPRQDSDSFICCWEQLPTDTVEASLTTRLSYWEEVFRFYDEANKASNMHTVAAAMPLRRWVLIIVSVLSDDAWKPYEEILFINFCHLSVYCSLVSHVALLFCFFPLHTFTLVFFFFYPRFMPAKSTITLQSWLCYIQANTLTLIAWMSMYWAVSSSKWHYEYKQLNLQGRFFGNV